MDTQQGNAAPVRCAKGCGFFGSALMEDMCSKCYKDTLKQRGQDPDAVLRQQKERPAPAPAPVVEKEIVPSTPPKVEDAPSSPSSSAGDMTPDGKPKNRCHSCSKKVGLTGFTCRCGGVYCGIHRYSDRHECSFDYKTSGRENLAKANPVVQGQKIQKL
eukprot:Opistho-1_new@90002